MFYTAFGLFEHYEDIQGNENTIVEQFTNESLEISENDKNINLGFIQTDTTIPQNIMQFKKKLDIEIYNMSLVDSININKFNYNTVGIQMDTIFNFLFVLVGSNKPYITNIVNFNKKNNNNNKITFKYKDQYNYDINVISDGLIDNGLYNIIYLPIQPKINISQININNINSYNLFNGKIITVDNNIILTLPYNKIFEIYIFPIKKINLTVNHFENKTSTFILEPHIYHYIYYNRTNPDQIVITQLNIVNLNFITVPTNVKLKDNSNLIYYNNFLNFHNNKFYNIINKEYDTSIMNCDDCKNNIKEYGSRYSLLSYYGTENTYITLPKLNLSRSIITFSINFKTVNSNNQVLFDIGNVTRDNKYISSLFVNFENNTVRFNYVKENQIKSTFLHTKDNPILNDDKWHNIIWTLDNDKWTIYVDSVPILNDTNFTPNKDSFNCTTNFIGKKNNINLLYPKYTNFIGFIDNFKIYNKKLSILEIQNENIK
jgi:hypothetical protein